MNVDEVDDAQRLRIRIRIVLSSQTKQPPLRRRRQSYVMYCSALLLPTSRESLSNPIFDMRSGKWEIPSGTGEWTERGRKKCGWEGGGC